MSSRTLAGRIRWQTGLLRYNAQRCERSRHPACSCRCGGAFHGKPHAESWLAAEARKIEAEENAAERAMPTLDLLTPPPQEPAP